MDVLLVPRMEQVAQRHGILPPVHGPPALRNNKRWNGRQSEESPRDDGTNATTAVAAAEQHRRGRTATHADVATAGERGWHHATTANGYGRTAATATGHLPTTSAATAAMGKFWRYVPSCQPDGNVWYGRRIPAYEREHHGASVLTPRGGQ